MGHIDCLREMALEVEGYSQHNGYWYSISEVLSIMVCGMLCGLQTIDDIHEWSVSAPSRKFFEDHFGIGRLPCRAQFYNILACVDAEKFNLSFTRWVRGMLPGGAAGKTVAIDGKTVCSTDKLTDDGSVLHIASAIVSEYGLVIGSRECGGAKLGEITAFRELIDLLDVSGAVVVADALHCNQKSAKAVVNAGADYLFVVKDNTPALKRDIELFVHNEPTESHSTTEKNGGRIEKRTAYVSHDLDWLDGSEHWASIKSIGAINRVFEKNGEKSDEWHYYISSAALSAEELLRHARMEWGVEAMHWLLDVHFAEDKTMVWDMNVQKTLNLLRKAVLNLVKGYKSKTDSKSPISKILKRNLFDLDNLSAFLGFVSQI
ncbi:MAG: ISAs1 family transposase [Clostridiales bacterium]|nr:ISAs1 family transposase [Clostridiales bacterium]